jgi:pyrroloquinoline-quinone synthase
MTQNVSSISSLADRHVAGLLENRYFTELGNGTMSRQHFITTQQQFYWAVCEAPRAMATLIARIPDPTDRLAILDNINDEHGDGDPTRFHTTTFRAFLSSLGVTTDPAGVTQGALMRAFTTLLTGSCQQLDPIMAACFFGVLEYAFADISASIAQAVITRGWLEPSQLTHYSLHAEVDKEHASGFFAVADPHHDIELIEAGLALGVYAFDRLYTDMAAVSSTRSTTSQQSLCMMTELSPLPAAT